MNTLPGEQYKRCMEIFEGLLKNGTLSAANVITPTLDSLFILIDAGYRAGAARAVGIPREPTQAMLNAIEELPQVKLVNGVLELHQIRTGSLLEELGGDPTMVVSIWHAMYDAALNSLKQRDYL